MGNLCGGGGSSSGGQGSSSGGGGGSSNNSSTQQDDTGKKEVKLLLLGSGESGKSTFFKQVKGLHDNTPYTEEEIQQYLSSIYANILHATKVLSQACLDKDEEDPFDDPDNKARAQSIIELAENDSALLLNAVEKYSEKVHNTVGELWKDAKLLAAFNNNRYDFHVFDGAQYFLDQFDKLKPPNYVPSAEDILRCRRKTTGIISLKFVHNGVNFSIYDVGGQRNERRKWTNCFNGVNAVLFVACLSEYDQKCYEDDITNRMLESIELFDETINGNHFKDTPVVLFLNKLDVFKTKIAKKDLTCTFPEYTGGNDLEAGVAFIKDKYREANKFKKDRLHIHLTCATDSDSVSKTFGEVKDFMVKHVMGETV